MTYTGILWTVVCASLLIAADEKKPEPKYEMTTYIMGLLKRGPNSSSAVSEESKRLQEGHMANIRKMGASGKLVVAGPFADNGDLRGIFIFQNTTMDEAKAMVAEDPAVKAGRLVVEFHPWFAAAGLRVNPPKE
ncbi:MAG TPA: YciI family protein [Bryobacteraceae bacterium]|nr:YciI family protein [Bryobacteraceae bacterium]